MVDPHAEPFLHLAEGGRVLLLPALRRRSRCPANSTSRRPAGEGLRRRIEEGGAHVGGFFRHFFRRGWRLGRPVRGFGSQRAGVKATDPPATHHPQEPSQPQNKRRGDVVQSWQRAGWGLFQTGGGRERNQGG